MVGKAYAMVKFSCKTNRDYCGVGGENAHISNKSRITQG